MDAMMALVTAVTALAHYGHRANIERHEYYFPIPTSQSAIECVCEANQREQREPNTFSSSFELAIHFYIRFQ